MTLLSDADAGSVPDTDWKPTSEAPCVPGTWINVRIKGGPATTYRWLAYKPDGARQMRAAGRWQIATEYSWKNAALPAEGEFVLKDRGRAVDDDAERRVG